MRMHRDATVEHRAKLVPPVTAARSRPRCGKTRSSGERFGYRNAQTTVLAPTGTIGFMMDCDTTGIEPELALVKHKKLVGGGTIKIVNNTVPQALIRLGYTSEQVEKIVHAHRCDRAPSRARRA
jgi:ribonucleoside-diphosphate reductase alpha chain